MNKALLISYIAHKAELSRADAGRALDAVTEGITEALKKGDSVLIVGFGGFSVTERAAREGRNPRTGEVVHIAASKVPKFTPGKGLKDAIN